LATISTTSGYATDDTVAINRYLESIEVFFSNWPIPAAMEASKLRKTPSLDELEKKNLLEGFEEIFLRLQKEMGMKSRDLIVLHPGTPGLSEMLDRFSPCHTHDDEEVRYIIDGEGEFGFVLPTGEQALLKIGPGDFIRIPKNTEHWFVLTEKRCIKAIRYFSDTAGWVPKYTSTKVKIS
jgi:1,2-dihydroxy-3-keto-5-methylthiopentene dioxygenase